MLSSINPIRDISQIDATGATAAKGKTDEFRSLLESSVRSVEELRLQANHAVDQFLAGEQEDPHTVALATQKAELAFDLFVQVRNKVTQAYQEVMRMQV